MATQRVTFDLKTGLSSEREPLRRRLSDMHGMYGDGSAYDALLKEDDLLVYEFYDMGVPESASEVAFGTSIVYSGKVGDEYFMTRGHYHAVLDTAEVYHCLRGSGFMLIEDPEGDWAALRLEPGAAVRVPPRYAHRSVNVSAGEPLVTFFAFRGDAGHDYGTIATRGFRKRILEKDGRPAIVDNPS